MHNSQVCICQAQNIRVENKKEMTNEKTLFQDRKKIDLDLAVTFDQALPLYRNANYDTLHCTGDTVYP